MLGRPETPVSTAARIDARDWAYRYPGRGGAALSGVTFSVEPGELVVLMGASGSGKSTLVAALAGVLPPEGSSGRLEVGGQAPGQARIGLVQQEPEANVVMELVGDDVAFPLENAAVPVTEIWPCVIEALNSVGLAVGLARGTSRLSGGQTQLLGLAAATVARPGLLLLDEPTANLDADAAADVLAAVTAVRAETGCTVVVVEHRVRTWLAHADRVLLVNEGTVSDLTPDRLAAVLAERPELAARVWLDHNTLPELPPGAPPGPPALVACGVSRDDRLPPTDLTVARAEVVALVGPPGSGKTTLLECLAGLLTPTRGEVRVPGAGDDTDGHSPWSWPARRIAATFGVVFQNPEHQFVTGACIDELTHGLRAAGLDHDVAGQRAEAMLARLGLTELAAADPFTLSGGQQRRLSVGTALVLDPGILLLDEPTFGQDPTTWAQIVGLIAAHRDAGGAVVLATHDPALVAALGAREVRLGSAPVVPPTPAVSQRRAEEATAGSGPGELTREPGQDGRAEGPRLQRLVGRDSVLSRLDPLALLGSAALLCLAALLSKSVLFNLGLAGVALLVALAGGIPRRRVVLLGAPALLAALSVGVSNALLASSGPFSAQSWAAAALPASRVLAVALPGLVTAVALDPTALADALVLRLRVPARAAYATLAGLRLLPLLGAEWATLGRASRARGMADTGLRARAAQFVSTTFRLLVAALRRAGRLAVALDTRGLRSDAPRTIARPVRWGWPENLALLAGLSTVILAGATLG